MTAGDAVFTSDSAHIGRIAELDEGWLIVKGEGHTFRIPRDQVAYEHEDRVFVGAPNRNAARLWRVDVRRAHGLRGWWERRVLGPSPHPLGGRLED